MRDDESRWEEPKPDRSAPASREKRPKVYPSGRKCKECGTPLSIYNGEDICGACDVKRIEALINNRYTTAKDYLGRDPRGHRRDSSPHPQCV
jgi:hypothetical protein